jgi:hypothetical protein
VKSRIILPEMSKEKEPHLLAFRKQTEVLVRLGELPGRTALKSALHHDEGVHLVHVGNESIVLELARELCVQGQMLAVFVSVRADGASHDVEITAEVVEMHHDDQDESRSYATLRLVGFDDASWSALISLLESEQAHLERALQHLKG